MATNKDDKELKNQTLDEEKQDADQVDLSTDQNQISENTAEEERKESKAKSEPRVFYVEGYGNVNGCKTQAEAEKKAKKLIDAVRR